LAHNAGLEAKDMRNVKRLVVVKVLLPYFANLFLRGLLPEHDSDNYQGYSNERSTVDAGFQR
jgi:hypothetical protein